MKKYHLANNILGWFAFLIAAIVYIMTIEPTTSFWDCGEFITSAYKLEVGHPPGAPLFMIIGRVATLFAFGDVTQVAKIINMLSALASAFTILFLFWTITHIARKIVMRESDKPLQTPPNQAQMLSILGAGLVGALAYTFSDTFWFSAVEGEVYATSSLFTALVFWAILKWENIAHERFANRWIILIAYLIGLSIGVHLLNLLAIPAMVFIFYFRKYSVTKRGIIYASLVSVAILGSIMYGIIPGIVNVASKFELAFVNGMGLPYNSGVFFYAFVLISVILLGLYFSMSDKNPWLTTIFTSVAVIMLGVPFMSSSGFLNLLITAAMVYAFYRIAQQNKALLNTIMTAFTVIVIGYSSFAMIVIRSAADPPMDQNDPEDLFSLLSYLNREQYGENPLVYGHYFNAPVTDYENGKPVYVQRNGKYEIVDYKLERIYDPQYTTIFPRMYSSDQGHHPGGYMAWAGIPGDPATFNRPPTFAENLKFFFRYQLGFMYWRYFMWNFAGRQNDIQGNGEVINGNWISGIDFIDNARLGSQENLPQTMKNNPGRNTYFFLPLLLGLLGMAYSFVRKPKDFTVLLMLFFFTGIAIILYTNQPPFQPRERDYAYAGSFYVFAIWIGLGVLALVEYLNKMMQSEENGGKAKLSAIVVTLITLVIVPGRMASENWDDHDRSGRYTARDFAYNYLNSCEKDAIIFTNGDNDTFPLWYAQEVEGIRTDVRVINLSYLGTDWYIDQMKRQAYDSPPTPFSMTHEQYAVGTRDIIYIQDERGFTNLHQVMDFIKSDAPATKLQTRGGDVFDYSPTSKFILPIDSATIVENKVVQPSKYNMIPTEMRFDVNRSYLRKSEMMLLDLLVSNNWERPMYFAVTVGSDNYMNLQDFFQIEGMAYRITPVKEGSADTRGMGQPGGVNTDAMYENMLKEFRWGGIDNPEVYLDENNRRMIMNFRNNFYRLASALVDEGKTEKAIEVLDFCVEKMPHHRVPYNYYNLLLSNAYYRAEAIEKGNEMVSIVADESFDELDYYLSLEDEKAQTVEGEIQTAIAIINEIFRMLEIYKQDEKLQQMEQRYMQLLRSHNIGA